MPLGQWLRHLLDLTDCEFHVVRFREWDEALSAFANVENPASALKLVERFGFPVKGAFGVFLVGKVTVEEAPIPVEVRVTRTSASVPDILAESGLIRALSRLRDAMRGATCTLPKIEASIRLFANSEGLP